MERAIFTFYRLLVLFGVLCITYACAVTVDTTESSTKTIHNSTEASSKFTSSTSPGSDSGESAQREQALAFSKVELERIKTDMAVGSGEHLTSLATLLGIPAHNHQEFFAITKANFDTLFSSEQITAEELVARLDNELNANPNLLR